MKRYPFSMRKHQHSLFTYQTALHNRLYDACENGNVDAMEHYGKLVAEADKMMGEISLVPDVSWLTGKQLGWAREAVMSVDTLRAEGSPYLKVGQR